MCQQFKLSYTDQRPRVGGVLLFLAIIRIYARVWPNFSGDILFPSHHVITFLCIDRSVGIGMRASMSILRTHYLRIILDIVLRHILDLHTKPSRA